MNLFPFQLDVEYESVILVEAIVEDHEILLALDTAASQTILDLNVLMILGFTVADLGETVELETANGFMEAQKVKVISLHSLGVVRSDFEVLTYDFFEKGLLSEQDGVLGLDFFKDTVLTIDFQKMLILLRT